MSKSDKTGLSQGVDLRVVWIAIFIALTFFVAAASTCAQPVLTINRFSHRENTISVFWTLRSDDSLIIPHVDQLRVTEDDTTVISPFEYTFPQFGLRYPMTFGLVMDNSGSMRGESMLSLKAAAHAFVDQLDGIQDEAAVVWYNTEVTVQQSLT